MFNCPKCAAKRLYRLRQVRNFFTLYFIPITLNNEIGMAIQSGANLNTFVANIVRELSDHGKALVVKLAFNTMTAGGEFKPGHQEQLAGLQKTLGIPDDQYRALIELFSQEY